MQTIQRPSKEQRTLKTAHGDAFRMLAVWEVAQRLSIKKNDTVYALIKSGALPATNVAVGSSRPVWRIAEADLEQFLADRAAQPPAKTSRRRRRKLATVTQYF